MNVKKALFVFFLGLGVLTLGYCYLKDPVEHVVVQQTESPNARALREAAGVNDVQAYTKEDVMEKKTTK